MKNVLLAVVIGSSLFLCSHGCFGEQQQKETSTFKEEPKKDPVYSSSSTTTKKKTKKKPKQEQVWMITDSTCVPCAWWKKQYVPILKKYKWEIGYGPYVHLRYVTPKNAIARFPQLKNKIELPTFLFVSKGKLYRRSKPGIGAEFNLKNLKDLITKKKPKKKASK